MHFTHVQNEFRSSSERQLCATESVVMCFVCPRLKQLSPKMSYNVVTHIYISFCVNYTTGRTVFPGQVAQRPLAQYGVEMPQ